MATTTSGKNYEETLAESQTCDDGNWLRFIVPPQNCDIPLETQRNNLESFLSKSAPSKIKASDGVHWISIYNLMDDGDDDREEGDDDEEEEKYSTEDLLHDWNCCQQKDLPYVHQLAQKSGKLSGKWMPFCATDEVDEVWGKIARGIFERKLGPHVRSAKVSPVKDTGGVWERKKHVICVYNGNYLDKNQVMESERLLRKLDIVCRMDYKPDIFTVIGIYRGNPWGIRPTLYSSKPQTSGKGGGQRSQQRERPKLILAPRSKPINHDASEGIAIGGSSDSGSKPEED